MENIRKKTVILLKRWGGGGGRVIYSLDSLQIRQLSNQQECVLSVQLFHGGGGVSE